MLFGCGLRLDWSATRNDMVRGVTDNENKHSNGISKHSVIDARQHNSQWRISIRHADWKEKLGYQIYTPYN